MRAASKTNITDMDPQMIIRSL